MSKRILITVMAIIVGLSACNQDTSKVSKHQLLVFGTIVNIDTVHPDQTQIDRANNEISDTFNTMHHQWHAWKPGRLTDINQTLRSGKSIELTGDEARLITRVIELSKQSNHLFNPAMGELINLWGFHTDEYPIMTPPPTEGEIAQLVSHKTTVDDLLLSDHTLSSQNRHIWLDLGGIAKGYAIDVAVDILKKHGIENAIIHAGGDMRSIGNKGSTNTPWRVAIQSPTDWSMLAELTVQGDESIFTSGNYQRYKEHNGKRYTHIIDSHNGMPVDIIVSATVIAENGLIADAAATALVVAGNDWPQVAKNMGIKQALIIDESMHCQATKAMLTRLENLTVQCTLAD